MKHNKKKTLLVEGKDDLYAVAELMGQHVPWPDEAPPIFIKVCDGDGNILGPGIITDYLKSSALETLGIVIDADDSCASRWASIRDKCLRLFPNLPPDLPPAGLIIDNDDGKRLGVWIMPDNISCGMLETFLRVMVPNEHQPVWKHAKSSAQTATLAGATYKTCHQDKADIHTWLAWQDPPGQSFGTALLQKTLDPHAASAAPFVSWFRTLFDL